MIVNIDGLICHKFVDGLSSLDKGSIVFVLLIDLVRINVLGQGNVYKAQRVVVGIPAKFR